MTMPPGQRIIQEQEGATMPKQRDERQRRKRETNIDTINFLKEVDEDQHAKPASYQHSDARQAEGEMQTYGQEPNRR